MKTEVIMHRPFFDSTIRQMSKTEFFCATDITKVYNQIRIAEEKTPKELKHYFQNISSIEFMQELCNELNRQGKSKGKNSSFYFKPSDLKVVKRGKHNKGTWLHPYLFVDYAMWLSPKFRAKIVIWVTDNLLMFRNSSGDAYKQTNKVLDLKFNIGKKFWEYAKVAKFVQERIFGEEDNERWNIATQEELHQRDRLLIEIESAAKFGRFENVSELLEAI